MWRFPYCDDSRGSTWYRLHGFHKQASVNFGLGLLDCCEEVSVWLVGIERYLYDFSQRRTSLSSMSNSSAISFSENLYWLYSFPARMRARVSALIALPRAVFN